MTAYYGKHSAPRQHRLAGVRTWLRKLARRRITATVADLWTAQNWLRGRAHLARLTWDLFWFHVLTDDGRLDALAGRELRWSEGTGAYDPYDRTLLLPPTKPWCPSGEDTDVVPAVAS